MAHQAIGEGHIKFQMAMELNQRFMHDTHQLCRLGRLCIDTGNCTSPIPFIVMKTNKQDMSNSIAGLADVI
eukprot:3515703-Ditylum_brightwellii.AAC.1